MLFDLLLFFTRLVLVGSRELLFLIASGLDAFTTSTVSSSSSSFSLVLLFGLTLIFRGTFLSMDDDVS